MFLKKEKKKIKKRRLINAIFLPITITKCIYNMSNS